MPYIFGPLSITGSTVTISGSINTIPSSGSTTTTVGPFNTSGSTTSLTGSLNITGSNTLIGTKTITGSVFITGSKTIIGTNTITGSLNISGSQTFVGTSNSIGTQIVTGSLITSGSQIMIGNTTLSGSVSISGSQTFNGTSAFYGNHTLSGSNTIVGNTIMSGSIEVSGSSNFRNSIFIVTGSASFKGIHHISGSTAITGSFDVVDGNINIVSGSGFYRWGNRLFNYGQFASTASIAVTASVSGAFPYTTTYFGDGISVVSSSRIVFANSGIYNLQFSAIANQGTGTRNLHIWFKKTGSNIDNSDTYFNVAANTQTLVAWNFAYPMSASEYVEIWYYSDGANTSFPTNAAGSGFPASPSIITTVTQIA